MATAASSIGLEEKNHRQGNEEHLQIQPMLMSPDLAASFSGLNYSGKLGKSESNNNNLARFSAQSRSKISPTRSNYSTFKASQKKLQSQIKRKSDNFIFDKPDTTPSSLKKPKLFYEKPKLFTENNLPRLEPLSLDDTYNYPLNLSNGPLNNLNASQLNNFNFTPGFSTVARDLSTNSSFGPNSLLYSPLNSLNLTLESFDPSFNISSSFKSTSTNNPNNKGLVHKKEHLAKPIAPVTTDAPQSKKVKKNVDAEPKAKPIKIEAGIPAANAVVNFAGSTFPNFKLDLPVVATTINKRRKKKKIKECSMENCGKNARGNTGLCVRHGGGKRCETDGCNKGARPFSKYCSAHGGGKRCGVDTCGKGALSGSEFCRKHGKNGHSKRQAQNKPSQV